MQVASTDPVLEPGVSGDGDASGGAPKSLELAMRRTGLAFERTDLAADRTLMAVIRTALSLISFGFTIFTFFRTLHGMDIVTNAEPVRASGRFALTLVVLGVGTLVLGLVNHVRVMRVVRADRASLVEEHLLRGKLPLNATAIVTAFALLGVGIVAVLAMILREGPFH